MWRSWLSKITTETIHIIFQFQRKSYRHNSHQLHHKSELLKVLNANNVHYVCFQYICYLIFAPSVSFTPCYCFLTSQQYPLIFLLPILKIKFVLYFFFLLFQHEYIEGFAGERWGECGSKSLSSFSPPVQEAQGDLNPWTGATEGAKETQGDRWGGCRLQNSVNSDCGSQRNFLCCI